MRILYSSTYCTLSGANRSLLGLIDHELEFGNDIFAITPYEKNKPFIYDELTKRKIDTARIKHTTYAFGPDVSKQRKGLRRIGPLRICVRMLREILAEFQIAIVMIRKKPDIFHINTLSSTNGYYAAKILKIPIVMHIREFVEEDYAYTFYYRDRIFKMLRCSDCVIAISESIKKAFEKKTGCKNIKLIYNGLNKNVYKSDRKKLFNGVNINIGIVGRIIPAKGHMDALNALSELKKRGYDNLHMHIYGGESEPLYYQNIKSFISDHDLEAELVGVSDDMPREYNKLDILLVCSRNEPFGRVTIEGMMTKCLVIGANTSGTAELIMDGFNGLLYQEGNPILLADKIEYAINNKSLMEKIINNAESWAVKNYDSTINAIKISEVYKELLKK